MNVYIWTLTIGLEHLQTGIEFAPVTGETFSNVVIHSDGPTTFIAWSHHPFKAFWTVAGKERISLRASLNNVWTPPLPETDPMIRERVRINGRLKHDNLLNGMSVIARAVDTIFMRIPDSLQSKSSGGQCGCGSCDGTGRWDTLAIASKSPKPGTNDFAYTCHFPDARIPTALEYWKRKPSK